jgi:NDP-sugar pyrophosphorylase family protein
MFAVILAAGKGTRMGDLSKETPKPMLKVLGKTLLEHKLDMLPEQITDVVLVVGYLKDKIVEVLGDNYGGRKITYVIQEELRGTADALFKCKDILKDEKKFLVMMGDDIYCKEDMEDCLSYDLSILIREIPSIKGKAKIVFDDEGHIKDILEKYSEEEAGFVNTGMCVLTSKIFDYEMVGIPGGEVGLPQTLLSMKKDFNIKAVQSRFWLQITAPEDLVMAETFLKIDKTE